MVRSFLPAAVFLLAGLVPAQATVLFSDDFNTNAADSLSGTPIGWAVSDGTVDIIGTGGSYDWYPGNGSYIDMDGSSGDAGRITTVAGFTLLPGYRYTLTFNYGRNQNAALLDPDTLSFGIGSFSGLLNLTGYVNGQQSLPFAVYSATFTVASVLSAQKLFFEASGGDNNGPIIDNVGLSMSAVPLPGAAWLLLSGLACVAGLGRMRRRKLAAAGR